MRKLWHFGKMCQQKQITAFHQALLIFNFLTQMYTRMVARPPRIGVGPGFDSQGSVTFFHKYCFPNLHWIHWANPWWSDSAIYSTIQVHDYNHNRVLVEQKCSFLGSQRHHSWGNQPQKSYWRQQTTTIVDILAKSVEAEMLWWHQWWMCNLGTQYIQCSILFNPKTLL